MIVEWECWDGLGRERKSWQVEAKKTLRFDFGASLIKFVAARLSLVSDLAHRRTFSHVIMEANLEGGGTDEKVKSILLSLLACALPLLSVRYEFSLSTDGR
jgi:hypothetical protein